MGLTSEELQSLENGYLQNPGLNQSSAWITESIAAIKNRIAEDLQEIQTITAKRDSYQDILDQSIPLTTQDEAQIVAEHETLVTQQAAQPAQASLMAGFSPWMIIPLAGMALFMVFGKKKRGKR